VSQLLFSHTAPSPDRIIVGRSEDSEAAYGLLQAMNSRPRCTLSTIHSNTAVSALNRLASLAMPGFGSLDLSRQETAARHRHSRRSGNAISPDGEELIVFWKSAATTIAAGSFETKEIYRRLAA